MSYIRDRAFVLKRQPFNEHDRKYFLYGRSYGLLIAVARGTSLARSKQAGHLEPFSQSDVMIAEGKFFDKLAVARNIQHTPHENLGALAIMGSFCDLLISLSRPGISDGRIFDLISEVRDVCVGFTSEPTKERARLILAGSTLKLLDLLGFGPSFEGDLDVSPQSVTLLKFLRRFPLADAMRVTVSTDIMEATSSFIENAVSYTPLDKSPHGPITVHSILE
ncbi:MAG: recombination protein O N-terminal domain-containing protein [Patescibacteria group bacterium]|nr:recombination protein O N-terminal domain-containing protein [Patescibacteria group bacterium]MBU2509504.1 recombination protein O N-terminal domain-containing protein [Patescibacteria group bacterium]